MYEKRKVNEVMIYKKTKKTHRHTHKVKLNEEKRVRDIINKRIIKRPFNVSYRIYCCRKLIMIDSKLPDVRETRRCRDGGGKNKTNSV